MRRFPQPPRARKVPQKNKRNKPLVGVIMGSQSDWETLSHASDTLKLLRIPHECEVVSAHRTPLKLARYAQSAADRGLKVVIAGAGGAAHLPGMTAASTRLPVLGVPVGTLAIGKAGAINAALLAAAILALDDAGLARRLERYRRAQTRAVLKNPKPRK